MGQQPSHSKTQNEQGAASSICQFAGESILHVTKFLLFNRHPCDTCLLIATMCLSKRILLCSTKITTSVGKMFKTKLAYSLIITTCVGYSM